MYISAHPFRLKGTGAFSSDLRNRRFDSVEHLTYEVVPYVKSVSDKYSDVVSNYIKASVDSMITQFNEDGKYLNHLLGPKQNPTAENMAKWICDEVNKHLNVLESKGDGNGRCYKVMVQKSEGNIATYED